MLMRIVFFLSISSLGLFPFARVYWFWSRVSFVSLALSASLSLPSFFFCPLSIATKRNPRSLTHRVTKTHRKGGGIGTKKTKQRKNNKQTTTKQTKQELKTKHKKNTKTKTTKKIKTISETHSIKQHLYKKLPIQR